MPCSPKPSIITSRRGSKEKKKKIFAAKCLVSDLFSFHPFCRTVAKPVQPFRFSVFPVEPTVTGYFRFFFHFLFLWIIGPDWCPVSGWTGWTGRSDPVFKTMLPSPHRVSFAFIFLSLSLSFCFSFSFSHTLTLSHTHYRRRTKLEFKACFAQEKSFWREGATWCALKREEEET